MEFALHVLGRDWVKMEYNVQCRKCGKYYSTDKMRYMRTCKECQDDLKGYLKYRHNQNKIKNLTIGDIKRFNAKAGQYWFSEDTLRFFKSKVPSDYSYLVKNKYFITSEKSPWDNRKYSIREWKGKTKSVDTVGEFGAYKTKTQAERELNKLVKNLMK